MSLAGLLILHLALLGPISGVVFTLDGILIGAGDMRFLAIAMTGAAAVFIPAVLAVPAFDWGIGWVWGAIWLLMIARVVPLALRFRSDVWLRPGATS